MSILLPFQVMREGGDGNEVTKEGSLLIQKKERERERERGA